MVITSSSFESLYIQLMVHIFVSWNPIQLRVKRALQKGKKHAVSHIGFQ